MIYKYIGPIESNKDRQTIIDEKTALWCARMIVGEGGKKCSNQKSAAMLWAIMNRWMLHPARRYWKTYKYLMRRFSQPINPRWQAGGDLARKYAGTKYASPARLRRRARISALKWADIPSMIDGVVTSFWAGTLPPPEILQTLDHPRISNWASHKGLSKKYPWGIAFEESKQPDWFFEDARLIRGSVVVDHWCK